jgi:hypothetical protein
MFRKVVSIYLMVCLLLTQSAVVGHSHSGNIHSAHDSRPHFHLCLAQHDHHDHASHQHDDQPNDHHDSDAIYVNGIEFVGSQRLKSDVADDGIQWLVAEFSCPMTIGFSPAAFLDSKQLPLPFDSRKSLYVRHCALLL